MSRELTQEMQARIASIIESTKASDVAVQSPAPQPVPTLMDHVIMIRQEIAALHQQMNAQGQVVEAVGQAVGQLYATINQQMQQAATAPEEPKDHYFDDDF